MDKKRGKQSGKRVLKDLPPQDGQNVRGRWGREWVAQYTPAAPAPMPIPYPITSSPGGTP